MPIIQSAIKRMRQARVRQDRRKPAKTYMKTMLTKIEEAVKAGKKAEALKMLPEAYKAIDMAAKRSIIHKKNAAHKKSRMAKLVSAK